MLGPRRSSFRAGFPGYLERKGEECGHAEKIERHKIKPAEER